MKLLAEAEIVGGIRDDAVPPIVPRTRFQRAHQAQLKPIPVVLLQHADTGKISRIACARRRNDSGKGDRHPFAIRQPPMSPIEIRNGSAVKECQAMEVGERICDFVVMAIDLAYPVHRPDLQIPPRNRIEASHRNQHREVKKPAGLSPQSGWLRGHCKCGLPRDRKTGARPTDHTGQVATLESTGLVHGPARLRRAAVPENKPAVAGLLYGAVTSVQEVKQGLCRSIALRSRRIARPDERRPPSAIRFSRNRCAAIDPDREIGSE